MAEMASDFGKILPDLKTASDKGWNTFTLVCKQWQSRLGDLVCSDETKSFEFLIRCVIELALNSTYYLKLADEQPISRIQAQEQLLGAEGSDSVHVRLIHEIFRAEVMKSCNMYVDLCAARKICVVLTVIQSNKSATKFSLTF